MNIGNAYRQARNALCFEKPHFAVTVQLDSIKAVACILLPKIVQNSKYMYKTQAIPLKFWYRILTIIRTNMVELESIVLYTKIRHQSFLGSGEEDFCLFSIYGHCCLLVQLRGTI